MDASALIPTARRQTFSRIMTGVSSRLSALFLYNQVGSHITMPRRAKKSSAKKEVPERPSTPPLPLPSPFSEAMIRHYYDGLPSRPYLIARTTTTPWKEPTGPDDYKGTGPATSHQLSKVWGDLAPKVVEYLDSVKVQWTSLDVVRIGTDEEFPNPVILWIGVRPGTLSGYDGIEVAAKCKEILVEHDITDVDVEMRVSEVHPMILTT